MSAKDMILEALKAEDARKGRSLQKEIGVSEIGGCRTAVWFKYNGHVGTNETLNLAAIMGTAIHVAVEKAVAAHTFGTIEVEVEVEFQGLKGHVDMLNRAEGEVIDLKTSTLKNRAYFADAQQRGQVHGYGRLLIENGIPIKKVTLVGIFRDGNETHVMEWSEPYNEQIALDGVNWLNEVKAMTFAPPPEKNAVYCKDYCEFYGELCKGKASNYKKKRTW